MSSSPALHPSVSERREPRLSAAALAEYLILRPAGQQNILHNSKYSRPPIISANGEAMRALRAYNRDPRRSQDTLLRPGRLWSCARLRVVQSISVAATTSTVALI